MDGNLKRIIMSEKSLLKEYIEYFGDEPPFPPEHIMKTLVAMKRDGTFEEKIRAFKPFKDQIINELEETPGKGLPHDHPLFDKDFNEDD